MPLEATPEFILCISYRKKEQDGWHTIVSSKQNKNQVM